MSAVWIMEQQTNKKGFVLDAKMAKFIQRDHTNWHYIFVLGVGLIP